MPNLVLASASPRRRELLASVGIAVEVRPSHVDETLAPGLPLEDALVQVARRKAQAAAGGDPDAWVLGADTAVVVDDRVLGKPAGRDEARAMLERLSGRSHRVITAVCLVGPGGEDRSIAVTTRVWFRALAAAEIAWYTGLPEPYDKAGAYGIQGAGAALVERIEGSYTNVVGLPLAETLALLRGTGIPPWERAAGRVPRAAVAGEDARP
ncbi:MAG: septum formation inhibitor Maf [Candidatus Dadabacteria bacterium]|nr:MAG: septum formation inhibitor Maf [Candidatus Dadabacteria bacterium]